MTLYINPFSNRARRMIERMAEPEWADSERSIFFPVDVKVEEDGFVVTALLPGLQPEDLSIQIINETVSIQGEIRDKSQANENYLMQERPHGKFCRTFTLPAPLDSAGTEASLENGVLTLHVPKAEEARPKMIKVTSK
ncbi:MAG: Hsp20/alpha crystallin family protein [Anaerolineaceae bacterium]|nr:Hsp20/alpha crystallin family protein [Anaerolineaceae bacterium]